MDDVARGGPFRMILKDSSLVDLQANHFGDSSREEKEGFPLVKEGVAGIWRGTLLRLGIVLVS